MPHPTAPCRTPARILLLAPPTDTWYGTAMLAGVAEAPLIERRITVRWQPPSRAELAALLRQPWDGLLVYQRTAAAVGLPKGVPVVRMTSGSSNDPATVGIDEQAVGTMAAEHLRSLGFRHFAWYGSTARQGPDARREAFLSAIGPGCHAFAATSTASGSIESQLDAWLSGLPRPVAIACRGDWEAMTMALAALRAGLRIPEDVAVLGANDDPTICTLAPHPLSSIRIPHRQVGRAAAQRLDRLILGERVEPGPLRIPPDGISVRRSTDIIAISDPLVACALRHIRANIACPLQVEDIVRATGAAARTLNNHFQRHAGHSVLEAIRRARLALAQRLLIERRDHTLERIALDCGCSHALQLNRLFRQQLGETPGAWLRKHDPQRRR